MISMWAGSLEGLHHVCHVLPEGIPAFLHAEICTHTNARRLRTQATVFPHSAAGVCLHLSYWLMKQAQRVSERGRSLDQGCELHHWHSHATQVHAHRRSYAHISAHFRCLCHVLSVSVTADTVDTGGRDTHAYWETWHTCHYSSQICHTQIRSHTLAHWINVAWLCRSPKLERRFL